VSSNAYSAAIYPDPLLRRLVSGLGIGLGLVGVVLVLTLPVDIGIRAIAVPAWCAVVARELFVLRRAWRDCRAMHITPEGGAMVLGSGGEWRAGQLVAGSVLLSRVGWIRLRVGKEPCFGELVRGERRSASDWRRLQVIWRHFGDPA
jgi:hypothetical protein